MEVQFTAKQEARLAQLAEMDNSLREAVRKGIEQADRGEFIEEEEMDASFQEMLRP